MTTTVLGVQRILQQGLELLEIFPADLYSVNDVNTYGSSAGAHFRHILQHFEAFCGGLESGLIDYDKRDRTSSIESSRDDAAAAFRKMISWFSRNPCDDARLMVLQNQDPEQPERPAQSSVARELNFLVSHSIHHFSLVATILRLHGIRVPPNIGVAPSTLYFKSKEGERFAVGQR